MNPVDANSSAAPAAAPAEEQRYTAEVLKILVEIAEEINASLDLDEVLARSAALIKRLIDYEIFTVMLLDDAGYLYHRFTIGYRFLYVSDVIRPGDQVSRVVNPRLVPTSPLFTGSGGPAVPQPNFQSTDFWAQGLTLGLGINF